MNVRTKTVAPWMAVAASLGLGAHSDAGETEEFEEMRVLLEMNATDGDIGFHVLVDGDAWKEVTLQGSKLFGAVAKGPLRELLGLTEIFFESEEPPCDASVADDPDEVVTLAEILEAFPAGTYSFTGKSIEPGVSVVGATILTHSIPAAPDISAFDGSTDVDPEDAEITWAPGTDLGNCPFLDLVNDGLIPHPASVPVAYWEVVVEPADEGAVPGPERVFSVQLPPSMTSVHVPPEFLSSYAEQGVTEFKFEVGAIEERMIDGQATAGNQVFSEGTFSISLAD